MHEGTNERSLSFVFDQFLRSSSARRMTRSLTSFETGPADSACAELPASAIYSRCGSSKTGFMVRAALRRNSELPIGANIRTSTPRVQAPIAGPGLQRGKAALVLQIRRAPAKRELSVARQLGAELLRHRNCPAVDQTSRSPVDQKYLEKGDSLLCYVRLSEGLTFGRKSA
jgi:hypothetical protein